jgi:hypothetical protein
MSAQYFAQLDEDNVVTRIAVVQQQFLEANPERYPGTWVETFIDDSHIYAGIGYKYVESEQDFRPPQPYPSWIWSNKTWNAPIPLPADASMGNEYKWDEEEQAWVAV